MKIFRKFNGKNFLEYLNHKVLKTAIATVLAIKIAEYLGIKYHLTAGVVAIISLQGTIRETYKIGLERIFATSIGLLISSLLFYFLGYNYLILGLFIAIFMPICIKFNLTQGFLVNIVLAIHIISEGVSSINLFFNEFGILLIGLLTAMAFNLYMPDLNKEIRKAKREMGRTMQKILLEMSKELRYHHSFKSETNYFKILRELGDRGKKLVVEQYNNSIITQNNQDFDYFRMRYVQYKILKRMKINTLRIYQSSEQGEIIGELLEKICYTTFDTEEIETVLIEIEKTKTLLKNTQLPKTREEFENRAILYSFLVDLEEFAFAVFDYLINYPKITKQPNK